MTEDPRHDVPYLALAAVAELTEVAKPVLNSNSLDIVQVLVAPRRNDPSPQIDEVRRPSLLGFVIRRQFRLAVMVHQILELFHNHKI